MKQFVESLKRLFENNKINESLILEMYKNEKITDLEKDYILNK